MHNENKIKIIKKKKFIRKHLKIVNNNGNENKTPANSEKGRNTTR